MTPQTGAQDVILAGAVGPQLPTSLRLNPKPTMGWETGLQEGFKVISELLRASHACSVLCMETTPGTPRVPTLILVSTVNAGEVWPRPYQHLPAAEPAEPPKPQSYSPPLSLHPMPARSSSELYTFPASPRVT